MQINRICLHLLFIGILGVGCALKPPQIVKITVKIRHVHWQTWKCWNESDTWEMPKTYLVKEGDGFGPPPDSIIDSVEFRKKHRLYIGDNDVYNRVNPSQDTNTINEIGFDEETITKNDSEIEEDVDTSETEDYVISDDNIDTPFQIIKICDANSVEIRSLTLSPYPDSIRSPSDENTIIISKEYETYFIEDSRDAKSTISYSLRME